MSYFIMDRNSFSQYDVQFYGHCIHALVISKDGISQTYGLQHQADASIQTLNPTRVLALKDLSQRDYRQFLLQFSHISSELIESSLEFCDLLQQTSALSQDDLLEMFAPQILHWMRNDFYVYVNIVENIENVQIQERLLDRVLNLILAEKDSIWSFHMTDVDICSAIQSAVNHGQKYLNRYQYECYQNSLKNNPLVQEIFTRYPILSPQSQQILRNTATRVHLNQPIEVDVNPENHIGGDLDHLHNHAIEALRFTAKDRTEKWLQDKYPAESAPSLQQTILEIRCQLQSSRYDQLLVNNEHHRAIYRSKKGEGPLLFKKAENLQNIHIDFERFLTDLERNLEQASEYRDVVCSMVLWVKTQKDPLQYWPTVISSLDHCRTSYHASQSKHSLKGYDDACLAGMKKIILYDLFSACEDEQAQSQQPRQCANLVSMLLDPFIAEDLDGMRIALPSLYEAYSDAAGYQTVSKTLYSLGLIADASSAEYQASLEKYQEYYQDRIQYWSQCYFSVPSSQEKTSYQIKLTSFLSQDLSDLKSLSEIDQILERNFQNRIEQIQTLYHHHDYAYIPVTWTEADLYCEIQKLFMVQRDTAHVRQPPKHPRSVNGVIKRMTKILGISKQHLLTLLNILKPSTSSDLEITTLFAVLDEYALNDSSVLMIQPHGSSAYQLESIQKEVRSLLSLGLPVLLSNIIPQEEIEQHLDQSIRNQDLNQKYIPLCSDLQLSIYLEKVDFSPFHPNTRYQVLIGCVDKGYLRSTAVLLKKIQNIPQFVIHEIITIAFRQAHLNMLILIALALPLSQNCLKILNDTPIQSFFNTDSPEVCISLAKGFINFVPNGTDFLILQSRAMNLFEFHLDRALSKKKSYTLTQSCLQMIYSAGLVYLQAMHKRFPKSLRKAIQKIGVNTYHDAVLSKRVEVFDFLVSLHLHEPQFIYTTIDSHGENLLQKICRCLPQAPVFLTRVLSWIEHQNAVSAEEYLNFAQTRGTYETPLLLALGHKSQALARVLIAHPLIDLYRAPSEDEIPLLKACRLRHSDAVKMMINEILRRKHDESRECHEYNRLLSCLSDIFEICIQKRFLEIPEYLFEKGLVPETVGQDTLNFFCSRQRWEFVVQWFINGTSLDLIYSDGATEKALLHLRPAILNGENQFICTAKDLDICLRVLEEADQGIFWKHLWKNKKILQLIKSLDDLGVVCSYASPKETLILIEWAYLQDLFARATWKQIRTFRSDMSARQKERIILQHCAEIEIAFEDDSDDLISVEVQEIAFIFAEIELWSPASREFFVNHFVNHHVLTIRSEFGFDVLLDLCLNTSIEEVRLFFLKNVLMKYIQHEEIQEYLRPAEFGSHEHIHQRIVRLFQAMAYDPAVCMEFLRIYSLSQRQLNSLSPKDFIAIFQALSFDYKIQMEFIEKSFESLKNLSPAKIKTLSVTLILELFELLSIKSANELKQHYLNTGVLKQLVRSFSEFDALSEGLSSEQSEQLKSQLDFCQWLFVKVELYSRDVLKIRRIPLPSVSNEEISSKTGLHFSQYR